jgi:hypothetical protein
MRSQVKTKDRVRQHGEVFTAEREVNAMLDLVKHEASNIDSTFFDIILQSLIQFNFSFDILPLAG